MGLTCPYCNAVHRSRRHDFAYLCFVTAHKLRYQRGRIVGAWRVLTGRSASIPRGDHATALGMIGIKDYYGGCRLTLYGTGTVFWFPNRYDGWESGVEEPMAKQMLPNG